LTREDGIYFLHENYLPGRIVIAAAGRLNHADFVAQARDAFWRMLGAGSAPAVRRPGHRSGVFFDDMPVSQAYFSLGVPAPSYADADRYCWHVLDSLVGGGISSRLFRRLREEMGLVYHIGSEYHAYRDAGMFVVEGCSAPQHLTEALELTLTHLREMATGAQPIDEEEVWKAQTHIRRQHLLASENTSTRMSRLATQELYFERHLPADEVLSAIEAIDVEGLRRLASTQLNQALDHVTLAVVGPATPESYSVDGLQQLLRQVN
jgi:predicted Zn-dependent peptidase